MPEIDKWSRFTDWLSEEFKAVKADFPSQKSGAFWDSLDQQQQEILKDLTDKLYDWVDNLTEDQQDYLKDGPP
ncbi:Oidioi.mRNA.OKI2018_I69.chr1.g3675.t1.cds [Oikopleura dioica]|uniref:Oidioi.mRNA.OKI2018_I69.chr1.g3675.t1.cds n=1 Tax=Oikopleura dioica TaxID=34765 RepID=A0ABN7T1F5_OIKDI|nr:Oidioi.mRNA.OKI2018_I69.chr1.g3675.t1.cds [Oikopleura dioica]